MKTSPHFLTVLFGPIGDTLMAIALCDDILRLAPESTFLFLTRRNAKFIKELTASYPSIEVRQIPEGLRAIPFFISILSKRWTLLTLGVTGVYSLRIKFFFLALKLLPGNRTIGFNDRLPGVRGWLPLQTVIQFDERYIIDNFRRLLCFVFDEEELKGVAGRAPRVILAERMPKGFTYVAGQYIAVNPFGSNTTKSWPKERWIVLLAKIVQKYPAYPLVLIGGPREKEDIIEIAKEVPHTEAMPSLPLLEAAYVIDKAALYIGVDTGPTHIAGVLQQKSLMINHFMFPAWRPTYNPNARSLANSKRCTCNSGEPCTVVVQGVTHSTCMYDIGDEFVVDSVVMALSSPHRHVPGYGGFFDEHKG